MLEDGFRSHRYSDILGNLRDNGFLTVEDVSKLLKEFTTSEKITFDCIVDIPVKLYTLILRKLDSQF